MASTKWLLTLTLVAIVAFDAAIAIELDWVQFTEDNERILGGNLARPGQFPHQALLLSVTRNPDGSLVGRAVCGASLISNSWIVTAAHCTQGRLSNATNLRVIVGSTNLLSDGEIVGIRTVINHPDWSGTDGLLANDISLLQTSRGVTFNHRVQAIPLKRRLVDEGIRSTVSGWGVTEVIIYCCLFFCS